MKFKKLALSLFLCLVILVSGCSHFSIPTNANTAFRNFTLCLFQQEVASNTLNLHYSLQNPEKYGITEIPITFGSFDTNEISALASIENWETALRKFPYRSLSKGNRITYDILSYYFTSLKNGLSFHLYDEPLSPLTGIHAQLPVLLAEYQLSNDRDIDTYLKLLKTLPDYFSSLVRFERQKSAVGLFMSDALADTVIKQCNSFISMGDNHYLLSTFEERLQSIKQISSEKRMKYIQKNKEILFSDILPAYKSLAESLGSLKGTGKNTQGVCSLPSGKDYYTYLVALQSGSNRPISELKTLIEQQMNADLMDCHSLLLQNPSLSEQVSGITETPETILNNLKEQTANAFPDSAPVSVNVKYVPEALQEHLSPAFYLIPAIDDFDENTIYINHAHSLNDIHLFTTLAHEGYPGHLYQTTFFANTNPDPVRTLLNFSGYVEGWATYAEMCSYYISPLEKQHATLLQKNNSALLGLYAAADIGIHYDGWSLEDTISFFSQYGISDETTIREIYEYIVGDPANYLTYYVGYLEMLELKREMIIRKGSSFSQKAFHKQVLEIGPAPFSILKKYLF